MDRHMIGEETVGPWRRNNQLIRISGNDKIKGMATDECEYSDMLVQSSAVKNFVKSLCIGIINHIDMEIKINDNQQLIRTQDGRF